MTTETLPVDGEQTTAPATSAARWKWRSSEGGVLNAFSHVFLLVWALMVGVPLLWALWSSFKTSGDILTHPWALPGELHFENWSRAWSKANIGQYFINTAFVVGLSTAGTMLLGSMAAYVLARFEFPGNRFIYFLFVGGMAFPVVMVLVPLFFVTKNLGILNTLPGLILIYIAYSLPFTVFFMTAFFRTLPTTVAEAALIDGASHTRTFFQIMLPMAKPGIISIGIFNVLGQWNQYLLPLVLNQGDTKNWVLTQGLADLAVQQGYQGDWGALFAGLSIAMLPVLAVYIVFQKQVQAGLTAGALK
ncbi:Trehalose transport system permease protein SugB [Streptomyces hundungensis]|uniref:Trehalose transport system permease protein SugB n=1 Tax=Streptomyces hundungensis TaxID=1077946 RepID=A0A387HFP2_9ACTN|nr:carbohydrate ABC transporter permease [Streptomyces hundungensis]AYG79740.1 Trehalose transport system permease protein SugB [Streptomyces hundungensis]